MLVVPFLIEVNAAAGVAVVQAHDLEALRDQGVDDLLMPEHHLLVQAHHQNDGLAVLGAVHVVTQLDRAAHLAALAHDGELLVGRQHRLGERDVGQRRLVGTHAALLVAAVSGGRGSSGNKCSSSGVGHDFDGSI